MSNEIDAGQAAELLGVSRQHFTDRIAKRKDFPKPVADFSPRSRKWRMADVLRFKAGASNDSGRRAA
jgi:predicted DNA-binding transcriptional regulator AlpA